MDHIFGPRRFLFGRLEAAVVAENLESMGCWTIEDGKLDCLQVVRVVRARLDRATDDSRSMK